MLLYCCFCWQQRGLQAHTSNSFVWNTLCRYREWRWDIVTELLHWDINSDRSTSRTEDRWSKMGTYGHTCVYFTLFTFPIYPQGYLAHCSVECHLFKTPSEIGTQNMQHKSCSLRCKEEQNPDDWTRSRWEACPLTVILLHLLMLASTPAPKAMVNTNKQVGNWQRCNLI